METFDFEFTSADLELGPVAEAGNISMTMFWLLIMLAAVMVSVLLYLSLREERPHKKQL